MKDCCKNFAIQSITDLGNNHHKNCPAYSTEKFTYLFYYEEALDAFVPVPDQSSNLIIAEDQLEPDEEMELRFKRFDLTDEEFDNLPSD